MGAQYMYYQIRLLEERGEYYKRGPNTHLCYAMMAEERERVCVCV